MMFLGTIIFIMGLCVGSFLNVCIYRIPLGKSVSFPPSSCPSCGNGLKPLDLVPVFSYIFLKGQCRYCKSGISLQYPAVELFTAFVWLLVFLRYGASFETIALIGLYSLLIPVALIDLVHMIIPNGLVIAGIVGGTGVFIYNAFYQPFALFEPAPWYTPLIGMVSASGILFIVALVGLLIYKSDGAMGMGDVKLFLPIGMFLGWKIALLTLFLSFIIGGIASILLLVLRIKDRKSAIPFGPFIVLAAFVTGLYGTSILNWYFGL